MKKIILFIISILLILVGRNLVYCQNTAVSHDSLKIKTELPLVQQVVPPSDVEIKANFLTTLVKTPFAMITIIGVLFSSAFAGFLEFFANLFTGFDYGYPALSSIWEMGWRNIVVNWWWKPAVGWHLIVALLTDLSQAKDFDK